MKKETLVTIWVAMVIVIVIGWAWEALPSDEDRICEQVSAEALAGQSDRAGYLRQLAPEARDAGSGIGPLIVQAAAAIEEGRELDAASALSRLEEVCSG